MCQCVCVCVYVWETGGWGGACLEEMYEDKQLSITTAAL